jgi:hypothetical protein
MAAGASPRRSTIAARSSGRANDKAFLYDNGTLIFLDDIPAVRAAGWTFLYPLDINDRGWITATAAAAPGSRASC